MTDDHDPDGPGRDDLRRLRPDLPLRNAFDLEPARGRLLDAIGHRPSRREQTRRWALPAVASLATAAAVVTVIVVATGTAHPGGGTPAGDPNGSLTAPSSLSSRSAPDTGSPRSTATPSSSSAASSQLNAAEAAGILESAAVRLATQPDFAIPDPAAFFYRRTTQATSWTSVSGTKEGRIEDRTTGTLSVAACVNGQIVVSGGGGSCTGTADTPHYLADAPTTPAAWGPYLLAFAPGARANDAEGKIITSVLHDFVTQPRAQAALLRYTATSCPGLHTFPVSAVNGEALIGVTCASMTHGSNALAFDATTHAWVGTVPVDYTGPGKQDGPAEIVLATGFVTTIGQRP